MVAILSLVVILVLSIVIVRVATVALALTGVSQDMARFQARSAFTGAGFTTTESERMVGHPVRRRVIMLLMLLGNAGIVTAVSSLILSFANIREAEGITGTLWFRLGILAIALLVLLALSQSRWIDDWMSKVIAWALRRWTTLEVRDYAGLLHLTGDYAVSQLQVRDGDWLAGRELSSLRLDKEGVLVLGIERAGEHYLGAPRGTTELRSGDVLLLYGRGEAVAELDERRAGAEGSRAHVEAVAKQKSVEREESAEAAESGSADRADDPADDRSDDRAG